MLITNFLICLNFADEGKKITFGLRMHEVLVILRLKTYNFEANDISLIIYLRA